MRSYRNKIVSSKNKTRKEIRKMVLEIYNSLPKRDKQTLQKDKNKYINSLTSQIMAAKDIDFKPFKIFQQVAKYQSGRTTQAVNIFSMIRNEAPSVYYRYNTYMYRHGYSAARFFYENAKYEANGAIVNITVELPGDRVLTAEINMSAGVILNIDLI